MRLIIQPRDILNNKLLVEEFQDFKVSHQHSLDDEDEEEVVFLGLQLKISPINRGLDEEKFLELCCTELISSYKCC